MEIEKGLVEFRLQLDVANGKDKKLLKAKIKEAEESVEAMKIARKSIASFRLYMSWTFYKVTRIFAVYLSHFVFLEPKNPGSLRPTLWPELS